MLVAIASCSSTPYVEVGLSHQVDSNTDWISRTHRPWQCSKNLKFDGEIGLEWEHDWRLGYRHQSWVLCGPPFGSGDPEMYADDIRLSKKFGGK